MVLLFEATEGFSQDTLRSNHDPAIKQEVDLIDVARNIFLKHPGMRIDSVKKRAGKVYGSLLPSAEYTLQTAFAVNLTANAAFYTGEREEDNISNIYLNLTYTQKHQLQIPLEANIWTKGNKYNILSDWRFAKFPQDTYGLGGLTKTDSGYLIDFSYLRFYQTVLKTVSHDFYLGVGYAIDYYWNVKEVNPPAGQMTDFERYGLRSKSLSSGFTLNLLYDTRRNAINPEPGHYVNVIYRPNFTFLGSDSNWQTLLIDARKYMHFPHHSKNILAFWTFDWFTLKGNPPYLLLPSTASDTYVNMGRGYIQGRFRGKNVVYGETEYRFDIMSNGFLGGVVFVNAQSFSEPSSGRFEAIAPGWGAGIRIKLNKFSRTNIALDYGFGMHGSHGIFANLGEVF
ncbi:MAG: BamA/TamA family outer membrane protein [Chitinophagaceae bacterium]|nr:BamA/TamA family outer membrane protein [Chitinophagaceae bacterium]